MPSSPTNSFTSQSWVSFLLRASKLCSDVRKSFAGAKLEQGKPLDVSEAFALRLGLYLLASEAGLYDAMVCSFIEPLQIS